MAQHRDRLTMSGNSILSSLDAHQISNLRQPSVGKKDNRRLSMPNSVNNVNHNNNGTANGGSRLSTGRLLNLGQASVVSSSVTTTNDRKRRSSIGSERRRSSSIGGNLRRSYIPSNNRLSIYNSMNHIKDQRPLRDKNYQLQLQQEILDFLGYKNAFEIEMKHPLTVKTLRQPTQKDFTFIFQWLYKKIDPGYKFQKSMEQEVYFLLKTMKYPYLESINKSQISAVGGQHWPIFLGMLHWMVQLNMTLMKLDDDERISHSDDSIAIDRMALDEGEMDEEEDDDPENYVNRLYVRYILKSYKLFLKEDDDDFSEYEKEMKDDFQLSQAGYLEKVKELQDQVGVLQEKMDASKAKNDEISEAQDRADVLQKDLSVYLSYINKYESSQPRWVRTLKELNLSIDEADAKLQRTKEENQKIYSDLNAKGFTLPDLERAIQERERINMSLESCDSKTESTQQVVKEGEQKLTDYFYSLETLITKFNATIYKISNQTSLKEYNGDLGFEITSFDTNALSDDKLGLRPYGLIPELERHDIRTRLLEAKKWTNERAIQLENEFVQTQEELDSLQETLSDKTDEFEALETRLRSSKLEHDQCVENFNQQTSDIGKEIERMERDLQLLNFNGQKSLSLATQRLANVKLEYQNAKHEYNCDRLELRNKIEGYLGPIINFKLNIQSNLEEFENLVIEECEEEFKEAVSE